MVLLRGGLLMGCLSREGASKSGIGPTDTPVLSLLPSSPAEVVAEFVRLDDMVAWRALCRDEVLIESTFTESKLPALLDVAARPFSMRVARMIEALTYRTLLSVPVV